MTGAERRQRQRVTVNIGTVYHDQIEVDGTDALMSDLSLGGCCIRTNRPSPGGSEIDMQFRLFAGAPLFSARARVCWIREPKADAAPGDITGAMGVEFTQIDEDALLRLKRFIAEKAETELFV